MGILGRAILACGMPVVPAVALLVVSTGAGTERGGIDAVATLVAAVVVVVTVAVTTLGWRFPDRAAALLVARSVSAGLAVSFMAIVGVAIVSAGIGVVPGMVAGLLLLGHDRRTASKP